MLVAIFEKIDVVKVGLYLHLIFLNQLSVNTNSYELHYIRLKYFSQIE